MAVGRRLAVTVAAVVAVNVALVAGLRGVYGGMGSSADTVVLVLLAVVAAQVNLLAVWAVWGRTHWLVRVAVAATAVVGLGLMLCTLEPGAVWMRPIVVPTVGAFLVQGLCVVGSLATFRAFGVRLESGAGGVIGRVACGRRNAQFSISYLILAVTVAALALVAGDSLAGLRSEVMSWSVMQEQPLLSSVLGIWGVCSALVGLASARAALGSSRLRWAVPVAIASAAGVFLVFPSLRMDYSVAWRFALAGGLQAAMVVGSLLLFRRLGYRLMAPRRPLSVACPWVALAAFAAVVGAWWHSAGTQRWHAKGAIDSINNVQAIAFSPDGSFLAIQSDLGYVQIFNARTQQRITTLGNAALVGFSDQTGAMIVRGDSIRVWDVRKGQWRSTMTINNLLGAGIVRGMRLLAAQNDWTNWKSGKSGIAVRDVAAERTIARIELRKRRVGNASYIPLPRRAVFSPDGAWLGLLLAPSPDLGPRAANEFLLVPLQSPEKRTSIRINGIHISEAFSPNSAFFAALEWPIGVRLWDLRAGQEMRTASFAAGLAFGFAFSPDRDVLAVAGSREDPLLRALLGKDAPIRTGCVRFWDLTTRKCTGGVVTPAINYPDLAFSPDGKTLAAASGNRVYVWDVAY